MKGSFFSSSQANEVILQNDFAKELDTAPESLLGKTCYCATPRVLRRLPLIPLEVTERDNRRRREWTFRCAHEKTFRIVGIIESDPSAGIGGFGGARVFLPLATAESLHVAQPSDLQSMMSGAPSKPSYIALTVRAKSPKDVQQIEDAVKKQAFWRFRCSMPPRATYLLHRVRLIARTVRQPGFDGGFARYH